MATPRTCTGRRPEGEPLLLVQDVHVVVRVLRAPVPETCTESQPRTARAKQGGSQAAPRSGRAAKTKQGGPQAASQSGASGCWRMEDVVSQHRENVRAQTDTRSQDHTQIARNTANTHNHAKPARTQSQPMTQCNIEHGHGILPNICSACVPLYQATDAIPTVNRGAGAAAVSTGDKDRAPPVRAIAGPGTSYNLVAAKW